MSTKNNKKLVKYGKLYKKVNPWSNNDIWTQDNDPLQYYFTHI